MKRVLFGIFAFCLIISAYCQIIGGEITFKNIQPFNNHFKISLKKYTNYPSQVNLTLVKMQSGDGSTMLIQRTDSNFIDNDILENSYSTPYNYPPIIDGSFFISYADSINIVGLNYPDSQKSPLYLESFLKINPFLGPNNSVYFAANPIFKGNMNAPFKYNLTAIDNDGDSLSFQLLDLDGPDSNKYWIPPNMGINNISGEFIWDQPTLIGKYAFGVKVNEWRSGIFIGFVDKIFQINIDSLNSFGYFIINNWNTNFNGDYEYHISPNTSLQLSLHYFDSIADSIRLNNYGDVFIINNAASFDTMITSHNINGFFEWTPDSTNLRGNPYIVTFRGSSYLNGLLIEKDVTLIIYVETQVSINEIEGNQSNVSFYPNPTTSIVTVEGLTKTATIEVYDISSKLLLTKQLTNNQLDVNHLAKGLYFIKLSTADGSVVRKFVKE